MATSSEDIKRRIGLAMGVLQKLSPIWSSNEVSTLTKLQLYRVLVLTIVSYGAEAWTLKKRDEQRLLVFEMACLRRIMGVSRRDKIRNATIRDTLDVQTTLVDRIRAKQLSYFGHVKRMPPSRYPKITLEGRIPGKRPQGRPPMRWTDNIKSICKGMGLQSLVEAGYATTNRQNWRIMVDRQLSPRPDVKGGKL